MIRALWSRIQRGADDLFLRQSRAARSEASIRSRGIEAKTRSPGPLAAVETSNSKFQTPSLFAAPLAPDWDPRHQAELARFLRTDAGRVFSDRFRAVEAHAALEACKDTFHTQHSAGVAAGFAQARAWMLSLSRASRDPEAPHSEADLNSEPNTEEQGEASLRERMSP